jgi:diaminohydroxyphosphoribosylaminopyrimidine deaminase/5-amino-6-(5-phosphoribosylamino)uracil reductase
VESAKQKNHPLQRKSPALVLPRTVLYQSTHPMPSKSDSHQSTRGDKPAVLRTVHESKSYDRWITAAIREAKHGVGLTSPNPPVGAVIVRDSSLLGSGFHKKAGGPHAEVEALRDAEAQGHDVRGATAYVTLEPCTTHGRTPPCTDALIKAGIARVVYGARDPNPKHAGAADAVLQRAGIAVESGVLREECEDLIRPFTKWVTTGLPYVIAKAAVTLDGRLTRPEGEPRFISNEIAREHAMLLRVRADAILIGAETLRRDNPLLTLRGESIPPTKVQPWRVVVTRRGNLPEDAALFQDAFEDRTLTLQGDFTFDAILRELATREIQTVLLEGGGRLMAQAFAARAVDEVIWYVAPRLSGGGTPALGGENMAPLAHSIALSHVTHRSLGDNVCIQGRPLWE